MENGVKIAISVFILLLAVFIVFFVFQKEETSVFLSNDYSVQKKVSFNALLNTRNEKYTVYAKEPVIAYVVIPKSIASDSDMVKNMNDDFDVVVLKKDPVLKMITSPIDFEGKELYSAGRYVIDLVMPVGNQNETTQAYLVPLNLSKGENNSKEIDETAKWLGENVLFSTEQSDFAMRKYYSNLDGGMKPAESMKEAAKASNSTVQKESEDKTKTIEAGIILEKEKINFAKGEILKIIIITGSELVLGEIQVKNVFSGEVVFTKEIQVHEQTTFFFNGKTESTYIKEGEYAVSFVYAAKRSREARFFADYGKRELEKTTQELNAEFSYPVKEEFNLSALKGYKSIIPLFTPQTIAEKKIDVERVVINGTDPLIVVKNTVCVYLYYPKEGELAFGALSPKAKEAVSYFKQNPLTRENIYDRNCSKMDSLFGQENMLALQAQGVIEKFNTLLELEFSVPKSYSKLPDRISFSVNYKEFGEEINKDFIANIFKPRVQIEQAYLEDAQKNRGFMPKEITPFDNIVCYIPTEGVNVGEEYSARITTFLGKEVTPWAKVLQEYSSEKYLMFEFLGFYGFKEKQGYGWTENTDLIREMLLDKNAVCEIAKTTDKNISAKGVIPLTGCMHFWGKDDANVDILFLSHDLGNYSVTPQQRIFASSIAYTYGFNEISPFKENIDEVSLYIDLVPYNVGEVYESPTDEQWKKIKEASTCGPHTYTINLLDEIALSTGSSRLSQNASNIGYVKLNENNEETYKLFAGVVVHEIGGHVVGKLLDEYTAKGIKLRDDGGYEAIKTNCVPYDETSYWSAYVKNVFSECSVYLGSSRYELRYRSSSQSIMNKDWYFDKKPQDSKFNLISCAYVLAGIRNKGGITLDWLGSNPFNKVEKYIPECQKMDLIQ